MTSGSNTGSTSASNGTSKYGVKPENLRLRPHPREKLSHYSKATTDVEYKYPFGWGELEGIANRTNYDLTVHSKASGKQLTYFDEAAGEHVVPYVIEPAAGADRATLVFLIDAYDVEILEKGDKKDKRTVLRFHKDLAPVKAAVMPLLRNRPDLVETAKNLAHDLQKAFPTMYDDTASIGRLYRRQDEDRHPLVHHRGRADSRRRPSGHDPRPRHHGSDQNAYRGREAISAGQTRRAGLLRRTAS